MTTMLKPVYQLTLGSQRWIEQATLLTVSQELAPMVNQLTVRFPAAAPFAAAIGDDAKLTLDNGEQETVVFTGIIDAVRCDLLGIRVMCLDAGGLLARFRPAVTFEQATAGTVIRNLAEDRGLDISDLEDGPTLPFYVADPSRTAWEHMARVAAWGGAVISVSAKNKLNSVVIDASQAEIALRYGREILSWQTDRKSSIVQAFTVAGEAGAGDASAPEVLRPTTDFFAGNRPDGPGPDQRWRFEPALRTVQAAGTAGAARQRCYASGRESGSFQAFLQPQLRCGTVIEIQDLPQEWTGGPIWVAGLEHRLGQGSATTRVHFRQGGDSFDPMALLGSLAGTIGGLV